MTFSDYQKAALTTLKSNSENTEKEELIRLVLGICGETGEVAEKVKKFLRGDFGMENLKEHLSKELGDVLWYLAVLSHELDIDFDTVAKINLEKLAKRNQEKKILGSGDER